MYNDALFVNNVVMSIGYYIVMLILCMYAQYILYIVMLIEHHFMKSSVHMHVHKYALLIMPIKHYTMAQNLCTMK